MIKYEYKAIHIDERALEQTMNQYGQEGWKEAHIRTIDIHATFGYGDLAPTPPRTDYYILLRREIPSEPKVLNG